MAMCDPVTGKVVGTLVSEHNESMKQYFELLNNFSSVKTPTAREPGIPTTLFFDNACQKCAYDLRRNHLRFMFVLYVIDNFHSSDHRACSCAAHFHKNTYDYIASLGFRSLYSSVCEGLFAWLQGRCFQLTASYITLYTSQAHMCGYYNTVVLKTSPRRRDKDTAQKPWGNHWGWMGTHGEPRGCAIF